VATGSAPELDLARVRRWCRDRVPEDVRDRVRIELDVDGRDLTILECHAPVPPGDDEWMRSPVARLRYLTSRSVWRLYCADRDDNWHEYPDLPWSRHLDRLLDEIDRDPTAIFWG